MDCHSLISRAMPVLSDVAMRVHSIVGHCRCGTQVNWTQQLRPQTKE